MPEHAYLTVKQSAAALKITRQAVLWRIERRQLPAFRVGQIVRVEARAVDRNAPSTVPATQQPLTPRQVAQHLQLSRMSLERLVERGELAFDQPGPGCHRSISRRAFVRWLLDHTVGDPE